jgi:hypothetical protein
MTRALKMVREWHTPHFQRRPCGTHVSGGGARALPRPAAAGLRAVACMHCHVTQMGPENPTHMSLPATWWLLSTMRRTSVVPHACTVTLTL